MRERERERERERVFTELTRRNQHKIFILSPFVYRYIKFVTLYLKKCPGFTKFKKLGIVICI